MPIDPFSVTSVPVIMNSGQNVQTHGSCFFYKKNNTVYLITNWHNFAGRRPDTGQPVSPTGATPHSVSVPFHLENRLGTWSDPKTFQLYSDTNQSLWLHHNRHGQNVDIAILKIDVPEGCRVYAVNEVASADDMRVEIGMDVFVLGFPIRFFTGIFPVWKRATISTEHDFNVDELPKFLIDTATQQGMSGSPVILRQRGGYTGIDGDHRLGIASATKFLGIYSGRYSSDNLAEVQLGIVWKKELIDEIIDAGVPGQYLIR